MTTREFTNRVDSHESLAVWDVVETENTRDCHVVIKNLKTRALYKVLISTILHTDWKNLEQVLTGAREPGVLHHITRIVGYYSRVENWNRSKMGELKSRRKGDYSIIRIAGKIGA
jgi:anaerobic ribonucleoside-triphosphate reductase